jgi:LacI family transcriptional regulator, repressor for deo operon, udp, cdd, tsx, nupC, and nupG
MAVRLADVARHAGVSQATASRVLNGKGGVATQTRTAVLSAAASLGYTRTRSTQHRVIGIVLPELENPVFATFAQRLATTAAQRGDMPIICTQTHDGISEDSWVDLLLEHELAGLIVVSGMHANTHETADRYRRLRKLGIPLVLVNGYVEGLDAVFVSDDDHTAMTLAVGHLTSLGHTRIGLAVGPDIYVPSVRKAEGFMHAVEAISGTEPLVEHALFTMQGGRATALRLIDNGATALVCGSDLMALGALQACRSRRLSVPGDISVVGYDDSVLMPFTGPPLTTIRQAIPAMCNAAVRALRDELAGRPVPRQEYLFQPELIVRGSTGAAPVNHARTARPRPSGLTSAVNPKGSPVGTAVGHPPTSE